MLRVGEVRLDTARFEVRVEGRPVALTAREFSILEALAREPGRVFTRAQIIERIFGFDRDVQVRTVDAHVMNLRRKLEVAPGRAGHLETVYGRGYVSRTVRAQRSPDGPTPRAVGSTTVNVVPTPTALRTSIVPPWSVTIWRAMDSPRPLPPVVRPRAASAHQKRSKRCGRSFAGIPLPVSRTSTTARSPSGIRDRSRCRPGP